MTAADMGYHTIPSGKFRRYRRGIWRELTDFKTVALNTRDLGRSLRGYAQALRLLKHLKPDVVFVKGGFVGLPVGLAARRLGLKLIIHESDLVMGVTNRILSTRANIVATGFETNAYLPSKGPAQRIAVGNPIRETLLHGSRSRGLKHFNLDKKLPIVLVIGGSSGAQAINKVVIESLPQLLHSTQIIHQTGENDFTVAIAARQQLHPDLRHNYVPIAFLHDELADAYALADMIVSRCGANVLAELAILKKPAILIPLPGSANGHQAANANYIVRRGAGRVIAQNELNTERLRTEVLDLVRNPADAKRLSQAIGQLAKPDASRDLAQAIFALGRKGS